MTTELPPPRTSGGPPLHAAIAGRRSVRELSPAALDAEELSQLLWAAQGVTGAEGGRAVPSPGGLYPLVVHVLTSDGIHRYLPEGHRLELVVGEDRRGRLAHACLDQQFVGRAGLVLALAHMRRLSRGRYGARAERYAMLEAGHAAQNVLLEAFALGLAAVPVGTFLRRRGPARRRVRPGRHARVRRRGRATLVMAVLALVIGALTVVNTMLMAVLERRSEFALLAAVGWNPGLIARLVVAEGLALALVGVVAGLALGTIAGGLVAKLLAASTVVTPATGVGVLAQGLLVGLAMGAIGALYPAWRVSRLPPAEGLG